MNLARFYGGAAIVLLPSGKEEGRGRRFTIPAAGSFIVAAWSVVVSPFGCLSSRSA